MEAPSCAIHPDKPGRWRCSSCGKAFCNDCVNEVFIEAKWVHRCPVCQSPCLDGDDVAAERTIDFRAALLSAPAYPLRGLGAYIIVASAVFLWLLSTIRHLVGWVAGAIHPDLGGIAGMGVGLITGALACVVLMYLFDVLARSADGQQDPPAWPEVTGWYDLIRPLLLILAAAAVYFLPAALWRAAVHMEWLSSSVGMWVLLAAGCVCFPMALTAVVLFDGVQGVNPAIVLVSIVRVGPAYLAAVASIAATVGLLVLSGELGLHRIPLAGPIVQTAITIYLLILTMRICGVIYRCYEHRLRWFPEGQEA